MSNMYTQTSDAPTGPTLIEPHTGYFGKAPSMEAQITMLLDGIDFERIWRFRSWYMADMTPYSYMTLPESPDVLKERLRGYLEAFVRELRDKLDMSLEHRVENWVIRDRGGWLQVDWSIDSYNAIDDL